MNRRGFLQFLGMATAGGVVAYSFPDIIVPKNIIIPARLAESAPHSLSFLPKGISPTIIEDNFFTESPFLARMIDYNAMVKAYKLACEGDAEPQLAVTKEGILWNPNYISKPNYV